MVVTGGRGGVEEERCVVRVVVTGGRGGVEEERCVVRVVGVV